LNDPKTDLYTHDLSIAKWHKSSASAAENDCVEITNLPNGAKAVRDSKNPDREPLRVNDSGWATFRQGILDGLF
jgi:hypothetical protein